VRRAGVAEALGGIRDRRAVGALLELYKTETVLPVRCKILEALGRIGDVSLIPFLGKEAFHQDLGLRSFAIWSLGELRDRKALPYIMEVLKTDSGYAVVAAIDAIGKLGAPELAPRLVEYLKFDDVQTRYVAAMAIGELGNPQTAPPLFDLMRRESNIEVQEAMAQSLGKIGGREVIAGFMELLRADPSPTSQHLAEAGLEAAGVEAAFALIELLKEKDLKLKLSAAKVLGRLRAEGAVPHLLKMLQDSEKAVRLVAISALGDCGGAQVLPELDKASHWGDSLTREAARIAMDKIKAKP